jgi:hypothetical protein
MDDLSIALARLFSAVLVAHERPALVAGLGLSAGPQWTSAETCKPYIPPHAGVHGGVDRCCSTHGHSAGPYQICHFKTHPPKSGTVNPF